MKKVYLDMTQAKQCIGVYVKDTEVILYSMMRFLKWIFTQSQWWKCSQ